MGCLLVVLIPPRAWQSSSRRTSGKEPYLRPGGALSCRGVRVEGSFRQHAGCAILDRMVTRGGTVFVGRVHELAELDRALDSTEAGTGAAVLVAGEAGIGKTMLASELSARADERGFEVLLGRSIDLVGTELPYQPFLEALRPLGRVPQVDPGSTGSQLRMFQDTLGLLGDHAAITPVLLMLDDVHWADASTLDLFLFLTYNVADHRLLLLATYRPDELSSGQRMGRFAAA